MSAMGTGLPAAPSHCGYCGLRIAEAVAAPQRFGEWVCSEGHADEFAAGVRAARIGAAARRQERDAHSAATDGVGCAPPPAGPPRCCGFPERRALLWDPPPVP